MRNLQHIRRARSAASTSQAPAAIPPWAELVKMDAEEVGALLESRGIITSGNLMRDRSALNRARGAGQ